MSNRTGQISVNTSDLLPIIKKWLYSEHDIFIRELISNASDAITKRRTLGRTRNQEVPEGEITLEVRKAEKLIIIHDNGIGMTEEEVEKYIAKLAFSGAQEFVDKMQAMGVEKKGSDEIIGKFGLGFYSAFMVAEKIVVDTLSMEEGASAVRWISEGGTDFTFADSTKNTVGTSIYLHVNEESLEFLESYKLRSTSTKYCDFMPYPIYLYAPEEEQAAKERFIKENEEAKEKGEEVAAKEYTAPERTPLNQTTPLWKKDPTTLKDEDYISFYHRQFPMDPDPLFWIHLKVDHPFELLGILYFPKVNPHKPMNEQNIRLYVKQVFVSDNVKNIIPDFLSLLKGSIDSPDIPLNVSRSSLQGDPNIQKISNYIIKKVAESLKKLFNKDREKYNKVWEDTGLFVKYGCVSDDKFSELMKDFVIFKDQDSKYTTLQEYRDRIPAAFNEKLKNKVIYFEKGKSDTTLVKQLAQESIPCIETDGYMDPHFMQHCEMRKFKNEDIKFLSVDHEFENILSSGNTTENDVRIKEIFQQILGGEKSVQSESAGADADAGEKEDEENSFSPNMDIEVKSYQNAQTPAYFKVDEHMKRFYKMTQAMGQQGFQMPLKKTLVVNPANPIVKNVLKLWEKGENKELARKLCHHVQDLAKIASDGLDHDDKDAFIFRTQGLIQDLTDLAL